MRTTSTRVTCHINAPRSAVYRALLDPASIAKWRVPNGMTCVVHRFEARQGGSFRVSLTYADPDRPGKTTMHTDTYHGRFEMLLPDEKIVETIEFETSDPALRGSMTVTTTLTDAGDGTNLLAVHEDLPPGLSPADNETGWREALDRLVAMLGSAR